MPALAVRGVKFETGPNELQQAVEGDKDSDAGETVDSHSSGSSSDETKIPEGITTSRPLGAPEVEVANKKLKQGDDAEKTEPKLEEVGVAMAKEELLKQRESTLLGRWSNLFLIIFG